MSSQGVCYTKFGVLRIWDEYSQGKLVKTLIYTQGQGIVQIAKKEGFYQ